MGNEQQSPPALPVEGHKSTRGGWIRAAVLGADDAILSTASLMLGVAAASGSRSAPLVAGVAGLVAGATSMAVGEFVSVSSQRDAEEADVEREKGELLGQPVAELAELTAIYVERGLSPELAAEVARQMSAADRLGTHLREELGIDPKNRARPLQAAATSAASFALFALLPIVALLVAPAALRAPFVAGVSILGLASLGALGARLGGAPVGRAALRVVLGGALAMAVSSAAGRLLSMAGG